MNGAIKNRACIVDMSGCIIHSYSGLRESAVQLCRPYRLAVEKHDCVFVADRHNHKVKILSPTLTHLGNVTLTQNKLSYPNCLHLDELNGRLYIEDYGRVVVLAFH